MNFIGMWFWEDSDERVNNFVEKMYNKLLKSSSSIGDSSITFQRIFSSFFYATFSSVFHPFGSFGENRINGFLCSADDEDFGALGVGLAVVLLWVITFKIYIDSMNEIAGLAITEDMLTRTLESSWSDQASEYFYGILYCVLDTFELGWDAFLEIIAKLGQFFFAVSNLVFQILIFLRDLCIETMQTFANIFQGIINVISSISCDDIEDFASACIVVLLWIGAIKIVLNIITKNPGAIQCDDISEKSNSFYDEELEAEKGFDSDGCSRKLKKRKKTYRKHNRNRSLQRVTIPDPDDGELSDS